MREEIDTCGWCTLRTFAGITVRSIQPGCTEHSGRDSTGPRRVRTQVERDADGVAWRQTADTRPGYATWPQTAPGDPSWWRHDPYRSLSPVARVMAGLDGPTPADGETCAKWCGYCHLSPEPWPPEQPPVDRSWIEMTAPPRRRWWHRLTRRAR